MKADTESSGLKRVLTLEDQVGKVLLPGDELIRDADQTGNVILGPGLKYIKSPGEQDVVKVCKAGVLAKRKSNVYFMDVRLRNYSTYKKDDVVGIIKSRKGDQYVIDIGTRDRVSLSKFAFEGATKKNRPDMRQGECIFGRFLDLPSDFPLEISCVTSSGKAAGQGGLNNGFVIKLPVHMVRELRSSASKGSFMHRVGAIIPLEITVGANGYVWVKTKKIFTTLIICQLLQAASVKGPEKFTALLKSFREAVSGYA